MTATEKTSFVSRLYQKLSAQNKGENLFFSPYSIQVALGMTAAGAAGETRKTLCNLLGCPEEERQQKQYFKALVDEVNDGKERPYKLSTSNALWGDKRYQLHKAYPKLIQDYYGGSLSLVDFVDAPEEAITKINSAVSDATNGLIPTIISRDFVNEDTRLVLTNAIYFKAPWEVEFNKTLTKDEDFFGEKATRKVPMMHSHGFKKYCEGPGYQVVDLPYKGDNLSMMLVLPNDKIGLAKVEENFDYEAACNNLSFEEDVRLSLPRFKMETTYELKDVLCDMGASLAFSDYAEFSGIGEEPLKISNVIHKAFVECNEEGTEAAAATAIGMMKCSMSMQAPKFPKEFKADHPFLFLIRNNNTGTILFGGRYV